MPQMMSGDEWLQGRDSPSSAVKSRERRRVCPQLVQSLVASHSLSTRRSGRATSEREALFYEQFGYHLRDERGILAETLGQEEGDSELDDEEEQV